MAANPSKSKSTAKLVVEKEPSMTTVLVTGAAGNVAGRIVQRLAKRGVRVRAFVRASDRKPSGPNIEVFEGDLTDRASIRGALEGVSKVYLLAPVVGLVEMEAAVVNAAVAANVEHIVKHSVSGAQYESAQIPVWHRTSEKHIEQSHVSYTFLHPASFASNALGWSGMLKGGDAVYGPFGEVALPVIDPDDIAAVAEKVLTEPGHAGKAYEITGPAALTTAEQVAILGNALGRKLTYVNVPDDAALKGMVDSGMDSASADAMIDLVKMLRGLGRVPPTSTVAELLGRPPVSFERFVEANLHAFR